MERIQRWILSQSSAVDGVTTGSIAFAVVLNLVKHSLATRVGEGSAFGSRVRAELTQFLGSVRPTRPNELPLVLDHLCHITVTQHDMDALLVACRAAREARPRALVHVPRDDAGAGALVQAVGSREAEYKECTRGPRPEPFGEGCCDY